MDMTMIIAIVGALGIPSILSGTILYQFSQHNKQERLRLEAQKKQNILLFRSIQAIGHLAEATAENQKLGHANGKTDTAMGYYADVKDDLNNFLLEQNAAANHGY
jgi:hypothetical protein